MKEILQAYIYNEKMLNDLYKRAAALTCREDEKQALLKDVYKRQVCAITIAGDA